MLDVNGNKKFKGVSKDVVNKITEFVDYRACLHSRQSQHRKTNVINSHRHESFPEEINKIVLYSNEDKQISYE